MDETMILSWRDEINLTANHLAEDILSELLPRLEQAEALLEKAVEVWPTPRLCYRKRADGWQVWRYVGIAGLSSQLTPDGQWHFEGAVGLDPSEEFFPTLLAALEAYRRWHVPEEETTPAAPSA